MSKDSPQQVGTEIGFIATSQGMSSPKYEFSLQRIYELSFFTHVSIFIPGRKKVVLDYSEENNWMWIPDREGLYAIHISADDSIEKVESSVYFSITKKKYDDAENEGDNMIGNNI